MSVSPALSLTVFPASSGGDGGHGGDVYLESNPHDNTLLRYRYNREFRAERGRHGEGSKCHGRSGEPMTLSVPVGTVVFDADTGEQLFDFAEPGQRFLAAHGGRGGDESREGWQWQAQGSGIAYRPLRRR